MKERYAPVRATARIAGWVCVAGALAVATGCQTAKPVAPPPAPATQLLEAARLDLPADCRVAAGRTYRMSYTVGIDGRTESLGAITPPDAPACLQAALSDWVRSFRFTPPARAEPLITDWMLVSARRGS